MILPQGSGGVGFVLVAWSQREFQRRAETGPIVLKDQVTVVQVRDRLGECESKAGTFLRPA